MGKILTATSTLFRLHPLDAPAVSELVRRGLAAEAAGAGDVPIHLRDSHYSGAKSLSHGAGYLGELGLRVAPPA